MRKIQTVRFPGSISTLESFLAQLDPKLSKKLIQQIAVLREVKDCDLKEPHYKHFSLERYSRFYELREKKKILVRIIFTIHKGNILLIHPFVKKQGRDTMRALDQAVRILAEVEAQPELIAECCFWGDEIYVCS